MMQTFIFQRLSPSKQVRSALCVYFDKDKTDSKSVQSLLCCQECKFTPLQRQISIKKVNYHQLYSDSSSKKVIPNETVFSENLTQPSQNMHEYNSNEALRLIKQLNRMNFSQKKDFCSNLFAALQQQNNNQQLSLNIIQKNIRLTIQQGYRQILINLLSTQKYTKVVKVLSKLLTKFHAINAQERLQGGGCTQSQQKAPYQQIKEKIEETKNEAITTAANEVNKQLQDMKDMMGKSGLNVGFVESFQKYLNDVQRKKRIIQQNQQIFEIQFLVDDCLLKYKEIIIRDLKLYRVSIIEIFDTIMQYVITIDENSNTTIKTITELENSLKLFHDYVLTKVRIYSCLDITFLANILLNMIKNRIAIDVKNQSQFSNIAQAAIIVFSQGINISTTLNGIGSYPQTLKFLQNEEGQNLLAQIKNISGDLLKSTNERFIQQQPIKQITLKEKFTKYLTGLYCQKVEIFGKQQQTIIVDELEYYIERFIQLIYQQSYDELIHLVLLHINCLLEKAGLDNELQFRAMRSYIPRFLPSNSPRIKIFFDLLSLTPSDQFSQEVANFFLKNTINSPIYRFLSYKILLRYKTIVENSNLQKSEVDFHLIRLCHPFLTERDESVKIVFYDNQELTQVIDKSFKEQPKLYNELLIKEQKTRIQTFVKNNKTQVDILGFEFPLQSDEDIKNKININLVEKWQFDVLQNTVKNNPQINEIINQKNDLYINQSLAYHEGNLHFMNFQQINEQKNLNAIQEITEYFLKINYQSFQLNRVFAIVGEGGSGKSTLVNRLETIISQHKINFSQPYNQEHLNYIPFLISCVDLDPANPRIDELIKQKYEIQDQLFQIIKQSAKNKLLIFDAYDEYEGKFFRIYQKLKLSEWRNTIIIVTSRDEKLIQSDARIYFSIDNEIAQRNENSYVIVKLKELQKNNIDEYSQKYFKKQHNQLSTVQYEKDIVLMEQLLMNKQFEQLSYLPINICLISNVIANKGQQELVNVTNQVELFELFFQLQFIKQAKELVSSFKNVASQAELLKKITLILFDYFQSMALKMCKSKGLRSNYLSITQNQLSYHLPESINKDLRQDQQQQLLNLIQNYIYSNEITKIKPTYDMTNIKDMNVPIQFRIKLFMEYMVARSMIEDFHRYGENISNLPTEVLANFNINKFQIMKQGENQSEQQILKFLFQLFEKDIISEQFFISYGQTDMEKTNRYIQYLRRSDIPSSDKISKIDIGASNLLSALFLSKFQFPNLKLNNCSFSKAYIPCKKSASIHLQDCNLSSAILKDSNLNLEMCNVANAYFQAFSRKYDTTDQYSFSQAVWNKNDNLFTINKNGFLTQSQMKNSAYKIVKSVQLVKAPLNFINFYNTFLIISSNNTLLLVSEILLFVIDIRIFHAKIEYISVSDAGSIIVALSDQSLYMGNIDFHFAKLKFSGSKAVFTPNGNFLLVNNNNKTYIYDVKDKYEYLKEINLNYQKITFQDDGKIFAALNTDNVCSIWSVEKNFEMVKSFSNIKSQTIAISFSNDGKYLALSSLDKCVRILQQSMNYEIVDMIQGSKKPIIELGFSYVGVQDKRYLWIGSQDQVQQILDVKKNYEVICKLEGQTTSVDSISFSRDGEYIAIGSVKNECTIWKIDNGLRVYKTINAHTDSILAVAFSHDGQYLATCSRDMLCKIWSVYQDFKLVKTISSSKENLTSLVFSEDIKTMGNHSESVTSLAFSRNSKFLATVYSDWVCKIWQVGGQFNSVATLEGHEDVIKSVDFSSDGKYFVTGSSDKTFKIWNVENKFKLIKTIRAHLSGITSLAFSSNGKYLVTGSDDKTCKIWNVEKGFEFMESLQGHTAEVKSVIFSESSDLVISGSSDKTCKVWSVEKGFELINTLNDHEGGIQTIAVSKNGKYFATGSLDNTCKVWSIENYIEVIQNNDKHTQPIQQVTFSYENQYLATCSLDKTCKIWSTQNGFSLVKTIKCNTSVIYSVAFSKDGRYLALGLYNTCRIYNTQNSFELFTVIQLQSFYILQLCFSADGKYLVTCSKDKTLKLYNAAKNFEIVKSIKTQCLVEAITFSNNGKYLVTGSEDNSISIWDAQNNFILIKSLAKQQGRILALAFSNSSQYLVSSSEGDYCKVWDANQDFKLITSLVDSKNQCLAISFSKDDKFIATGNKDQSCNLWSVDGYFELISTLRGHAQSQANALAFSRDHYYIAAASQDECQVWSVEANKPTIHMNNTDIAYNNIYTI